MQIEWHKPSEELPKEGRDVLFVGKGCGIIYSGYWNGRNFMPYEGLPMKETVTEAWCYAPSLPEWCYEED